MPYTSMNSTIAPAATIQALAWVKLTDLPINPQPWCSLNCPRASIDGAEASATNPVPSLAPSSATRLPPQPRRRAGHRSPGTTVTDAASGPAPTRSRHPRPRRTAVPPRHACRRPRPRHRATARSHRLVPADLARRSADVRNRHPFRSPGPPMRAVRRRGLANGGLQGCQERASRFGPSAKTWPTAPRTGFPVATPSPPAFRPAPLVPAPEIHRIAVATAGHRRRLRPTGRHGCPVPRCGPRPAPQAGPSATMSTAGGRWRSPCALPSGRPIALGWRFRPPSPGRWSPRPAPGSARLSGSPGRSPRAGAARRRASRRARRHGRRSRAGRSSPAASG